MARSDLSPARSDFAMPPPPLANGRHRLFPVSAGRSVAKRPSPSSPVARRSWGTSSSKVCRSLFGKSDPEATENLYTSVTQEAHESMRRNFGFDPVAEAPVPNGRFAWKKVVHSSPVRRPLGGQVSNIGPAPVLKPISLQFLNTERQGSGSIGSSQDLHSRLAFPSTHSTQNSSASPASSNHRQSTIPEFMTPRKRKGEVTTKLGQKADSERTPAKRSKIPEFFKPAF